MSAYELHGLIIKLAGGKNHLLRAPLRVIYYYEYKAIHGDHNGTKARKKLSNDLKVLEALGVIKRHYAYVDLLPNARKE